jgi:hypothetical protein
MKRIIPILIFLLAVQTAAQAQEDPKAILVDEIEKVYCDEFLARIDNFFIQLNRYPEAKGYFVLSGANEFLERKLGYEMMFDGAISWRSFDASRVTKIRSTETGNVHLQFWLVPTGADVPNFISQSWNFTLPLGSKPFLFHSDMEQICSSPTFPQVMREYVSANPGMRVHVVIYANSSNGRRKGVTESKPALKGIPKDRIRYFFQRSSYDSYADYWLVPKRR